MKNLYADRDHEAQGDYYLRHISRMTIEQLSGKGAIAAELAHRDIERDKLKAMNTELAEALEDVISWVPGRASWHTNEPIKAIERANAALLKNREPA